MPASVDAATTAANAIHVDIDSSRVAQEATNTTAGATSRPSPSSTSTVAVHPEVTAVSNTVEVLPAARVVIEDSVPSPPSSPSLAPTSVSTLEVPSTALPFSTPNQDATAVASTEPTEALTSTAPASTKPPTHPVKPTEVPTAHVASTPAAPAVLTPAAATTGYSKQAVVESTRLAITHLDASTELPGIICEGPLYWANIILRDTAFQTVCHRHLANLLIHMSELIASNTDNIHILPIYEKNIRMTLQLCQLSYAPVQRYLPLDDKLIREVFPILILEVTSAILTIKNTTTTNSTTAVPAGLKETIVANTIGNISKEIDIIFTEESSSTSNNVSSSGASSSGEAGVGGGGGGGGGGGEQVALSAVEKERRRHLVDSVYTMCIQKLSL